MRDSVDLLPLVHNAHVLKWFRWRIWCARQQCRPLAETLLIEWHNEELEKSEPATRYTPPVSQFAEEVRAEVE